MTREINYHASIKQQEDMILKHYASPIYTTRTRTTTIPVHKKKLIIKKTLKQTTKPDDETKPDKHSKKNHMIGGKYSNFIIED